MLATIDQFERVPRILRLDISGRPVDWVSWQRAVSLYVRKLVIWTGGESILRLRGGFSTLDEQRTCVDVNSIIACIGKITSKFDDTPPLTNQALFCPRSQLLSLLRYVSYRCQTNARSYRTKISWRRRQVGKCDCSLANGVIISRATGYFMSATYNSWHYLTYQILPSIWH